MTEKIQDKELDALKADIASLRAELAGLVAGVKKSAVMHTEQPQAEALHEGAAQGEEGQGVWADLFHKFDSSRIQSEKVVRHLAAEVEQHPLVSVMAAFGLGYIIAKLWYRESKRENSNDAS